MHFQLTLPLLMFVCFKVVGGPFSRFFGQYLPFPYKSVIRIAGKQPTYNIVAVLKNLFSVLLLKFTHLSPDFVEF